MRLDLAFFLCCCKSFLGPPPDEDDNAVPADGHGGAMDYYRWLGVERSATPEEIKRAYKKQSLLMHPDKLAQRGQTVTEQDQTNFTKMKEAYEVLSDPHKRETYDAIGERGMKWLEEPFAVDPAELAHNFAKSSWLDRSKIFAIFVVLAAAILCLPVLICWHVDGVLGPQASWAATLTPLWCWNALILFYHVRVILMGPIPRPDHIPEAEWVDPLPMKKRIVSLVRFLLIVLFEILMVLKLDHVLGDALPWSVIFFPLYVWEATTLYKKWPLARMRIVTVEDLETALGKPFAQFTAAEKDLIGKRYSVVPSVNSPEFEAAQKLKTRARHDIIKSGFRIAFCLVLLIQLDGHLQWNWWLVFLPFWVMTALICYANYQAFAEVQKMAMEKDPSLFGPPKTDEDPSTTTAYGAVGTDGNATADQQQQQQHKPLTEEEREELKAQVMASSSRLCSKGCSQGFLLLVVFLFVAKLQGARFSAMWIISPFLLVASVILCCLGLAIFGIREVPTDGVDFSSDFAYSQAEAGQVPTAASGGKTAEPSAGPTTATSEPIYMPPPTSTVNAPSSVPAADEQTTSTAWGPATPSSMGVPTPTPTAAANTPSITEPAVVRTTSTVAATAATAAPLVTDLLDDSGKVSSTSTSAPTAATAGEIQDLD